MKLTLTQELIFKLRGDEVPVDGKRPYPSIKTTSANYLLYDDHKDAPSGFAVRVGRSQKLILLMSLLAVPKRKLLLILQAEKVGLKK